MLEELEAGMDSAAAWTGGTEEPPAFVPDPVWENWAIAGLVIAGTVFLVRAAWIRWQWKARSAPWPELTRFAHGSNNADGAAEELRMLELVASLSDPETRTHSSAWTQLSPSEQAVVWGTMRERSVQDLAEELACTPSHVYNLRTSIRKKWKLDSKESLVQAIRTRYHEIQPNGTDDLKD